jgi:hypothetical protein
LKSIWISSNGSRRSLSWGDSLERVTRQPVVCRIAPFRSTGAGQRDLCGLQLRVTGKIVEQSTRTRHTLQVLWRRKAHFHNPLDHAHIPVEVGSMMRSRMRTQEMRVMGITCCESLAPFLDPTD